jgi:hypothetical protein
MFRENDTFLSFLEIDPIFAKTLGNDIRFKQLKDRLTRK